MTIDLVSGKAKDFNILFYQSPQPMFIYDIRSLKFLEVNNAALKFYNYSQEEFCQINLLDILTEDYSLEYEKLRNRIETEQSIEVQARHRLKNGEIRDVDVISFLSKYDGYPCRIAHVHDITDILKQTRSLEVLLSVSQRFAEKLELKSILQDVTDATTKLSGAEFGAFFYNTQNDKGEALMLYTLSGAPKSAFDKFGMPRHTSIFHPTLSEKQILRVDDVRKDPRYGHNPPHFGIPKGHLPVVSYMAIPVVSKSGRAVGTLLFSHSKPGVFTADVERIIVGVASQAAIAIDNALLFEEIKSAKGEIERLLVQANNSSNKKTEFISIASHEMKTPVTSMKGYMQILDRRARKDGNSFYLEFIERANRQVNKLSSLINDLLDVSKIDSGKIEYHFSVFKVRELLEDCAVYTASESGREIELVCNVDIEIEADKMRLEQVICNFLSNANKYSPNDPKIILRCVEDPNSFRLEVQDFGPGISAEKLPFIFDRFYRGVEDSNTSSGLGLGLYISSEIIKRHKGTIGVESQPGKGSTFWFKVPLRQTSPLT